MTNSIADRLTGSGSGMFCRGTDEIVESAKAEAPAPAREHRTTKPNQYPGDCRNCGEHVAAGRGYLGPRVDGRWTVEHIECGQLTEVAQAKTPEVVDSFRIPVRTPLLDGTYTVVFEDGDYRTIRVRTQDESDDFMPGAPILSYLSGPNNEADYTSFANVNQSGFVVIWRKHRDNAELEEAVKVLCADPEASLKAHGRHSGRCGLCGRTLTTPESLDFGIGPECRKRL